MMGMSTRTGARGAIAVAMNSGDLSHGIMNDGTIAFRLSGTLFAANMGVVATAVMSKASRASATAPVECATV